MRLGKAIQPHERINEESNDGQELLGNERNLARVSEDLERARLAVGKAEHGVGIIQLKNTGFINA